MISYCLSAPVQLVRQAWMTPRACGWRTVEWWITRSWAADGWPPWAFHEPSAIWSPDM